MPILKNRLHIQPDYHRPVKLKAEASFAQNAFAENINNLSNLTGSSDQHYTTSGMARLCISFHLLDEVYSQSL
jgi:hypothetical protein